MEHENIIVEKRGRVGLITLHRPEVLNALSAELLAELSATLDLFEDDAEIGAIVIAGSERAFAAGADIAEMKDKGFVEAYSGDFIGPWDRISRCRKPLVAAVAGYALGGGCELAMMCDIVIAGESARFGQPEVSLGVIPGIGGTQRLPRAVGKAKAMELILTGRHMDADEAERAGLVSRVVPTGAVLDEALAVAEKIAAMPTIAVRLAKDAVNRAFETGLGEGVRFERQAFYATFATEDQKEGMAAFVDKRKPVFRHR